MEATLEYDSAEADAQLSNFVSEYLRDETEAGNYKNWKEYGPIIWVGGAFAGIMSAASADEHGLVIPTGILIAITTVIFAIAYMVRKKRKESDLNSMDVRYHDIAYAIDQFQKGEIEKVVLKLTDIKNNKNNYRYLSKARQEELRDYIIEVERRDEEYLKKTFEDIFSRIIVELDHKSKNPLFEPVESAEESSPDPFESIIAAIDVGYLRDPTIVWVFTGISAFVAIALAAQNQLELATLLATISTGLAALLLKNHS